MTVLKGDVLSEMDVDSLLDLDIDLIDEISDFIAPPTGVYRFNVKGMEVAEVGGEGKQAIKASLVLTQLVELSNPDKVEDVELAQVLFADGATIEHTEFFFLDGGKKKSAYGIRSFATMFKALVPAGTKAKTSELMELAIGASGEGLIERNSYVPEGQTEAKFSSRFKATAVSFD